MPPTITRRGLGTRDSRECSRFFGIPTEAPRLKTVAATTIEEYNAISADGGSGASGSGNHFGVSKTSGHLAVSRMKRTRRDHPEIVAASSEELLKEEMHVLPNESWSVTRHAEQEVIPACGTFTTLKRLIIMLAGAIDEGRTVSLESQHAMLW